MRAFKRKRTDAATGGRMEAERYTVEWHDAHNALRYTWPAHTDKRASEALGRNLERLAELRSVGEPVAGDVAGFVRTLTLAQTQKLVRLHLLDAMRLEAERRVGEHLEAYRQWRDGKGRNARETGQQVSRCRRVLDAAGVASIARLTPAAAERALDALQREQGFTAATWNSYLTALLALLNWKERAGRLDTNPLAGKLERRAEDHAEHRRALTPDEARRLLAVAEAGPVARGLTRRGKALAQHGHDVPTEEVRWELPGPERALLYRVAMETGLRRGALARLRRADFDLDAEPSVSVKGTRGTKNKRTLTLPLRRSTAALLAEHLNRKAPAAPAFSMPKQWETADLLRADLAAARRAWVGEAATPHERARRQEDDFLPDLDAEGRRIGFHVLRTTTGSMLDQAGVAASVATKITGHASEAVLRKHYHRSTLRQARQAVEALPDFNPEPLAATGTDHLTADLTAVDRDEGGRGGMRGARKSPSRPVRGIGSEGDGARTRNLRIDSPVL